MASDRTQINLRGYCFYCLKKISNEGDSNGYKSPACTPVPPSPLSTPLRTRCHNVHNLPPEERLAPFTDLCRYLGVELPDCYAFGDGSDPFVLYPPLCDKCHELSARLCVLQDELQYIQTRIQNTVERIHRRVASTCDKRGAIKREEFNKDFRRKSKGSLSRGRSENPEMKRVTDLLKAFQMRIAEKDFENRERRKRRATNILFPECQNSFVAEPFVPNDIDQNMEPENEENVQPQSEPKHEELALSFQEYLPPEETLRSDRPHNNIGQQFEIDNVQVRREISNKPYPDLSTIVCSFQSVDNANLHHNLVDDCENNHLKTTMLVGVTTRSQARVQQTNVLDVNQLAHRNDDNDIFIRRHGRKVAK